MSSGAVSQVSPASAPEEQLPPPQVCVPEQRLHAPPPAPHAETVVPGKHTSPWQQPLRQVVLLQVATHEVPLHAWLLPQLVHVAPPVPQAALIVPAWQTFPWQQPPGQVVTLQLEVETHCVPLQLCPLPQLLHTPPPVPHALVAVPGWHTFSAQQPVGQFSKLQVEPPAQSPPLQVCPAPHALQVSPPAPQVVVVRPVSQRLPLQQPWQLPGLQVLPAHRLSVHAPLHALQVWPPLPHDEAWLPTWQMPFAQQPAQVCGPHELAPPPPPPEPPPVPPVPPPRLLLPRGVQKPTLQKLSAPHCVHESPPEPHPTSVVPGEQLPVESQQPEHVAVLHFGVAEEHPTPRPSIERIRRKRITPA